MNRFNVRKVAVLGAGVMGAQIAAHLVNVKVPVVLFDLPAKEGPEERHRDEGDRGAEEAQAFAARRRRGRRADPGRELRRAPRVARRVRPRDRGDRRTHGLEARSLPQDRAARRAHAIVASNTSGLSIAKLAEARARRDPDALLRHPLLQPAALHGARRADRDAVDRRAGARPARGLRHEHARQERRAREGHAELHRQPGRHRRHAGDDEGGRDLRSDLRRGRRPHREEARPREQRHLPHRRCGRASTRWRTSSRRCRTRSRPRPTRSSRASARRRC